MFKSFCCFNTKTVKQTADNKNSENFETKLNTNELKKFDLNGTTGNFYVDSVYDGDTITILIPMNIHIYDMISHVQLDKSTDSNSSNTVHLYKVKIRLFGIDTPELKPSKNLSNREEHIKKAKEAKEFLSEMILGKIIKTEFLSNDKYGRPLCKIYFNNTYLNDLMIEKGFAKKYDGGTKDTNF
jgi:endonuclease YncB( thermonuclease family)